MSSPAVVHVAAPARAVAAVPTEPPAVIGTNMLSDFVAWCIAAPYDFPTGAAVVALAGALEFVHWIASISHRS